MTRSRRYAETQVMTASPGRLLVLVMQAGLRNMEGAARCLEEGDDKSADQMLRKASDILWELQRTIDPSHSDELAGSLATAYANVSERLLRAMTLKDVAVLREAHTLFEPLVEAFEEVVMNNEEVAA